MRNPFGTPVSVRILLFGGVGSAAALSIASRKSLACAGCIRARTFPASTILNCRIAFWPPRGRDWRHVSHTWRPRLFLMTNGSTKMTQSDSPGTHPSIQDVALIVGGGPGISSSCARLFAKSGMRVGVAARNPESRSWRTWRRLTAFVDTRATQANQLSWSRCSRMSFETSGRLRLSYTTSTAGFPAFLQGHYRSQPSHGARDTSELSVQRVFWWVSRQLDLCAKIR